MNFLLLFFSIHELFKHINLIQLNKQIIMQSLMLHLSIISNLNQFSIIHGKFNLIFLHVNCYHQSKFK
jgi:hypothetical protein